ncbi:MAG: diaminopimelate epimerase [Gaiellaceae bacterium]
MERWSAHGNVYLVTEEPLEAERVRRDVGDADGIAEVTAHGDDWADVVIWNPDGSTAEMSGNATRIVAAWLGAERTRVRVGEREVVARKTADGRIEQELAVKVLGPESVDGIDLVTVDVGNPHAVVVGDPDDLPRLGPLLERHPRFPERTNVQVARVDAPGRVTARVWERGVGETSASGTSAVAVAAATHGQGSVVVSFPGGELDVRLDGERAWLTGPAERIS